VLSEQLRAITVRAQAYIMGAKSVMYHVHK